MAKISLSALKTLNNLREEVVKLEKQVEYYKRRCEILEFVIKDQIFDFKITRGKSQQEEFFQHYIAFNQ